MSLKVAFLGPEGTYTHQAVIQQFGDDPDRVCIYPQRSISNCFQAIDSQEVDYAVVPFENSTNGQVVYTYDLIRDWFMPTVQREESSSHSLPSPPLTSTTNANFKIVAEQFVAIHHNFLTNAKSLSEIKTVYSHPQVWTQVSLFLSSKISPNISRIDTTSTSKAAEVVYNDATNTTACISSKMSADLYKLPIYYENIEDNPNNTTRFLVLGYKELPYTIPPPKDLEPLKRSYITSIILTLNHDDPGALCVALDSFRKYNVNLTSINSRPSHLKQWQYVFFVEIIGNLNTDENIVKSVDSLSKNCLDLVILGSFERCWRYWGSS